jgi:hypothetical protein
MDRATFARDAGVCEQGIKMVVFLNERARPPPEDDREWDLTLLLIIGLAALMAWVFIVCVAMALWHGAVWLVGLL